MPTLNWWQASFHRGVRGFELDKSCSWRDLAILLRNEPETDLYGIKPRITRMITDLVNPLSIGGIYGIRGYRFRNQNTFAA
jgi:hypothetical protein